MKADLSNTAFIIHFRRDSEDRLFNLRCIMDYFQTYIKYGELFVINDDSEQDEEISNISLKYPNVTPAFFKNNGVYQRTLCFNKIATISKSKIFCFYDTDVLIKPKYLSNAQELILQGHFDNIYPYNGLFVDVKKNKRDLISKFNFDELERLLSDRFIGYDNDYMTVAHTQSVGGMNMMSKDSFFKVGGYNANFIGWGCEDVDIEKRSRALNRVSRIMNDDAICWHIHHDNTIRTENEFYINNIKLLNEV